MPIPKKSYLVFFAILLLYPSCHNEKAIKALKNNTPETVRMVGYVREVPGYHEFQESESVLIPPFDSLVFEVYQFNGKSFPFESIDPDSISFFFSSDRIFGLSCDQDSCLDFSIFASELTIKQEFLDNASPCNSDCFE